MNRGKIIDWITYIFNMLLALPVFGLIGCAVFQLCFRLAYPRTNPPEWAQWFFPAILELFLIVLWGRYQYRLIVLKVPRPLHETRRTLFILAGCVTIAFLLIFSLFARLKAERMAKASERLRQIEQKKYEQEKALENGQRQEK